MGAIISMFYIFFQGILVFQTLFLAILYFITGKKDLLFYCIFLLLSTAYFFLNAPGTFFGLDENLFFDTPFYRLANIPLINITNLFYIFFLKSFFSGLYHSRKLNILYRFIIISIPILILLFFVLVFFHQSTQIIFYIVNFIGAVFGIYIVVTTWIKRVPNSGLVGTGIIFNILGISLTIAMIIFERFGVRNILTVEYPLLFMRCGMLIDIFLYQIAIIRKWNYQEKQLAMQQIEKQLAVEKVRNQISSQLHDDIGSTLSGISMYSYMTSNLLADGQNDKARTSLGIIQKSANEMVDKLSDLVWSVNPKQDSLPLLIERLEQYAADMTDAKNITLETHVHPGVFKLDIPMDYRHQIYLVAKEAINNAIKYSSGDLLILTIKPVEDQLVFAIKDNGTGFDPATVKKGNGLINMQSRAKEIGTDCIINSNPGQGTLVTFSCKITQ